VDPKTLAVKLKKHIIEEKVAAKAVIQNVSSNIRNYMRVNNMELSEDRTSELIEAARTYLDADDIDHIKTNLPLLAQDAKNSRQQYLFDE